MGSASQKTDLASNNQTILLFEPGRKIFFILTHLREVGFKIMQTLSIKKIIIGVLIFSLLFPPIFPKIFGQETEIQKAVSYLKTQPADPWQTMALIAAGETDLNLNHLKEVSGNLATDYEKTILALTAAGENPRTFGNIDFVAQLKSFYQSNQIGSLNLLNDDFWGILALVSAGESISDQIIQDSKNFVLDNQNEDGGWSYAISGNSDTNDTAAAIMALLEAGISTSTPEITKAIDYLKLSQNEDGGFPYLPGSEFGSESDSGSDSWLISAIYKLGQNPYDWQKEEGQNPVDHLKSLQKEDGSFKWITSEDNGYPILTAYTVIALAEKSYPVNRLHSLRIEGKNDQICDAYIKVKTALDIVENGSTVCGYTYFIEQTGWGPYLKRINDEEAHDLIGWLYFVNYEMPMIGANDYILEPGDEVLWYFGDWGWLPTKLTLASQKVDSGNNLEAKVEYFENSLWHPLTGATVHVGEQDFITDANGQANSVINNPGIYQVYAGKSGYIRTNQVSLSVIVVSASPASSGGGWGSFTLPAPSQLSAEVQKVDFNKDNKIDILDFNTLMVHWAETGTSVADFNNDGKVDIFDFNLLMINWTI